MFLFEQFNMWVFKNWKSYVDLIELEENTFKTKRTHTN